jgi:hypothetical protein
MCLSLNSRSKVLVARTDIVTYKNVKKASPNATKTFHAIHFRQKYELGKVITVPTFSVYRASFVGDFTNTIPYGAAAVHRGLHSASKKEQATLYGGDVTLECVIPKGTKYIRGDNREIVSLALKPVRVVS